MGRCPQLVTEKGCPYLGAACLRVSTTRFQSHWDSLENLHFVTGIRCFMDDSYHQNLNFMRDKRMWAPLPPGPACTSPLEGAGHPLTLALLSTSLQPSYPLSLQFPGEQPGTWYSCVMLPACTLTHRPGLDNSLLEQLQHRQ